MTPSPQRDVGGRGKQRPYAAAVPMHGGCLEPLRELELCTDLWHTEPR